MMNGEKVLDAALKIIKKYTIVKLLNNESEDLGHLHFFDIFLS